ncbi:MAG: hypothetical protein U1E05_01930 [Patescibacteria group bacterium]|nr:hypothetical protein [Patescibacteria group bacterium]
MVALHGPARARSGVVLTEAAVFGQAHVALKAMSGGKGPDGGKKGWSAGAQPRTACPLTPSGALRDVGGHVYTLRWMRLGTADAGNPRRLRGLS